MESIQYNFCFILELSKRRDLFHELLSPEINDRIDLILYLFRKFFLLPSFESLTEFPSCSSGWRRILLTGTVVRS